MRLTITLHEEKMENWVNANQIYVENLLNAICKSLLEDFDIDEEIEVVIGEPDEEEDEEIAIKAMKLFSKEWCEALIEMIQKREEEKE